MWDTLCDADFDLSYSYSMDCESCVDASAPAEGWSYYFANLDDSQYDSCEDLFSDTPLNCCNDNVKAYMVADGCASYSFSYADMATYLPDGDWEFYDNTCEGDMSSPCSDLSYSYGVLSFVYTDFTIPYELKVGEAMTLDTSGMTSAVGNPTPELLFDFTAPETTTYTFRTCGST